MRITSLLMGSLLAVLVSASAMAATDLDPRVDTTKPHDQPPYPSAAQVNGEQGIVELSVLVRSNGKIGDVRVMKSSGFPDLDNAAVEGVLSWRFTPAFRDGDTASAWTTVRIVYQLPKPPATPAKTP